MKKIKELHAFTLAEVLITLGIIGIVAAMTIPTLIANYQKAQYVTALKKAYSEISEALKLVANDYDCSDLRCTGIFKSNDNLTLGNALKKHLKVAKDCGMTFSYSADNESTKCITQSYSPNYDGSGERSDLNKRGFVYDYRLITADGFALDISNWGGNCTDLNPGNAGQNLNQACGLIIIDVNNFKGPNNFGRDIFLFFIASGKGPTLYPEGGSEYSPSDFADDNPSTCGPSNTDGTYCAGRIMTQGWQMKY